MQSKQLLLSIYVALVTGSVSASGADNELSKSDDSTGHHIDENVLPTENDVDSGLTVIDGEEQAASIQRYRTKIWELAQADPNINVARPVYEAYLLEDTYWDTPHDKTSGSAYKSSGPIKTGRFERFIR